VGNALFATSGSVRATAYLVGERIDVRRLERSDTLGDAPLTVRAGREGLAMVFRYGAVVLIGLGPVEELAFIDTLHPFVSNPFPEPGSDGAEIALRSGERERVTPEGTVVLADGELRRLQIVAHVLAKSAVLAHYEAGVTQVLDRIEPLAEELRKRGRSAISDRRIVREIGDVLLTQTRTVGRVEIAEQPEMTWDEPSLERLYARLSVEYDLRERDLILERKLALVARTAETLLELLQNRRALRVEWYIVALIVVELLLVLYDKFMGP
jgi:required for meiotic nuclear division protein 1